MRASLRTLTLVLLAVGVLGGPAPRAAADGLECRVLPRLMEGFLEQHIRYRKLDDELRSRTARLYVERSDPSRMLLLEDEAKALQKDLRRAFDEMERGDCSRLEKLQAMLVERYRKLEDYVRRRLGDPDYKIDYDVTLVLDPDERGFPRTREEQRALHDKLIAFQLSNYLGSGEEEAEARRLLVHRYELMTRRASELDRADLMNLWLDAFAASLDPHSDYYSPEDLEEFQISMGLSLEGIGVALSSRDGYSVVERIIPGGAADRQNILRPKDKIIAVAQEGGEPVDIVDMALRDVVRLIRGKRGTTVRLTILRQTDKTERFTVSIVRDKIDLEEQAAKLRFEEVERDGRKLKLAVLDLPSFYGDSDPRKRRAATDVARLLRQAREEGAEGLLLDLSRNGGGLLDHAVRISGFFLRAGGIVAVQDANLDTRILRDPDPGILYPGPLVILVSRISASASEILAGALKDYGRAVIVGDDHTFGKGSVQTVVTLPEDLGAMKVTTAMFFRPAGASTQHTGVSSDIVLPSLTIAEEIGEKHQPFALTGRTIRPFLNGDGGGFRFPFQPQSSGRGLWKPVTEELVAELRRRSEARVARNPAFQEIEEKLAERRARNGSVHLAELRREQEEARKNGEDPEAEESEELSPQAAEALQILGDLVVLQERPTRPLPAEETAGL